MKDTDGLDDKKFSGKISISAADGVLFSPAGKNRWAASLEDSPKDAKISFDIKGISGGTWEIIAVAKDAKSDAVRVNVSQPKEKTLKLNLKGDKDRELKLKFQKK